MSVRAKFVCEGKTEYGENGASGAAISLRAVYSNSEENKKFFNATPCGEITLSVVNPEAAKQFEQGKEYYVDFTPAQ